MEISSILAEKGYNLSLRREQEEIIQCILKGHDTIAILPTGFGKSLCYILPALILNKREPTKKHTSLVISPLKALISDQVDDLRKHGIEAFGILEGMDHEEMKAIKSGACTVLFASPEAILRRHWRDVLTKAFNICLIAYDEAHCISEWGLEFRPDYQKVGILQSILQAPALVLTATITKDVRKDIDKVLGLYPEQTKVVATLPDRPNIFLDVAKTTERYEEELQWVVDLVKEKKIESKKMVIYVNSIAMCETLYIWFHSTLHHCAYNGDMLLENRMIEMFHAHTDIETKRRIMDQFVSKESTIRVLIATVACGLGVNIPDISFVILWGLPASMLQLWQEIGRCSRDGSNGIAICYAFQRSISLPCDNCRKSRKFQCHCNSREYLRSTASLDTCQRVHCLKHFEISGMDSSVLRKNMDKNKCNEKCGKNCQCSSCMCCIVCLQKCKCSTGITLSEIIQKYLNI